MWFDNSIIRVISVLLVMLIAGLIRYGFGVARLRKAETEDKTALSQLEKSAKTTALVTAFLYMVAMVSVAGLFI